MDNVHIASYESFLNQRLIESLWTRYTPSSSAPSLRIDPLLLNRFPDIETAAAHNFIVDLYQKVLPQLAGVLKQRTVDREFIDAETMRCQHKNQDEEFESDGYQTVIGLKDSTGRIVVGPNENALNKPRKVQIPDFLKGDQITLFGPPDTAKMSINAMNTLHRRMPGESNVVSDLVKRSGQVPRWGADNEDSKTPIMENLLKANQNLTGCYNGTLHYFDEVKQRDYKLRDSGLAIPIKRIPGIALPDGNHLFEGNPLPLHLVDLAFHLFHNRHHPEALVFYVPKLENEEEAAYLKSLLATAEALLTEIDPTYRPGHIKLFIVFENPRAIFRIPEIAEALWPYFVGGSLGWHDYLASTARLFKNDPNYRIPVKADPNIVINHIRESHQILAEGLDPIGGIKIGGMYGVLYEEGNFDSFKVSMVGYIRDVFTQLKRGLDGFWVAHPSFVRIGIAMTQAWREWQSQGNRAPIEELINALILDKEDADDLVSFVFGPDVHGLSRDHPLYQRGVLAADLQTSDVIANHDPDEVRYNVFQALQYFADWLSGNGCVALPAIAKNAHGEDVFVRIMDDLATTERSRWELWAEIQHGRVSRDTFNQILAEELAFIKEDKATPIKRVQVKWSGEAARWYPLAEKILKQLVLDESPVEFASELLLPFTFSFIRDQADPWAAVKKLSPEKYWLN
ncbi:MAG: hypothetical protein VYA30_16550 [Myxococcota bacterium]|nr:hypothetical protein [Myxococcota bacterium]